MKLATAVYSSLSVLWDFAQEILQLEQFIEAVMSSILPGDGPLTLPELLNIKNISAVKEIILTEIGRNPVTILDIAEGAQVDLSFVQLVTAARNHAQARAGRVLLARPAAGGLYDVLKRGGFLDEMTPDAADFWLHQEKV